MFRFNIGIFNLNNEEIYNNQLKVLVQSIWDVYQDTEEIAICHNPSIQETIQEIKVKFPHIIFQEFTIQVEFSSNVMASRKMNLWYELYKNSHKVCNVFMDTDMLLLRKIDHFLSDSYDIGYTHKTENLEGLKKPLNTGFITVNKSGIVGKYMKYWRNQTNKLLNSKDCYGGGWGGTDQQVLGETLGTKDINKMRCVITKKGRKFKGLRFKGFPCKMLNNILSPSPHNPNVYVIHFKGSWRNILTDGNWERSLRDSIEHDQELYDLWCKTLERFNE